jgi:hypothetical protein
MGILRVFVYSLSVAWVAWQGENQPSNPVFVYSLSVAWVAWQVERATHLTGVFRVDIQKDEADMSDVP